MPHGTPDWGLVGPRQTTYGLDDLGEAVARLGSPVTWDRRGDVIYVNNFNDGLWGALYEASGPSCTAGLHVGHSRHGPYSLAVLGDGAAACDVTLWITLPLPVYSRVGLESTFSVRNPQDTHQQDIVWQDANVAGWAMVQYRVADRALDVYDQDAGWVTFATSVPLLPSTALNCTVKLVADLTARRYVRYILNDVTYDLSAYQPLFTGGAGYSWFYCGVITARGVGSIAPSYIDAVIITQNEP